MRFGFCVMADIDEIGFFPHAEALGYHSVWVADEPECCFRIATRCSPWRRGRRSRLRLGPGTAICGTRIPPVQVAAVATLNRIAPGTGGFPVRHRQHGDAHGWASDPCGWRPSPNTCA